MEQEEFEYLEEEFRGKSLKEIFSHLIFLQEVMDADFSESFKMMVELVEGVEDETKRNLIHMYDQRAEWMTQEILDLGKSMHFEKSGDYNQCRRRSLLAFDDAAKNIKKLTEILDGNNEAKEVLRGLIKNISTLSLINIEQHRASLMSASRKIQIAERVFKERRDAPKRAAKKAHDARYKARRALLDELGRVAGELWEGGSSLLHYQMKDYLLNDYADAKGNVPFSSLPEKPTLATVKQVAKDMNRPDLISGQKKLP